MKQANSGLDLAVWIQRETSFSVTYPLPLFHEIDDLVNEGYRSIPYGGVEVGGLLFGHRSPTSTSIEAFRIIKCEHASGPSFMLSDSDLSVLTQQLNSFGSDPELQELEAIGWFISHTRKGLQMNDREFALFDQFFPAPGSITLLVRPERFKPTLFGFLVRPADGEFDRDAGSQAIILPLIGRGAGPSETPVPSIPAPQPAAQREQLPDKPEPAHEALPKPEAEPPPKKPLSEPKPLEQIAVSRPEPATTKTPRSTAPAPPITASETEAQQIAATPEILEGLPGLVPRPRREVFASFEQLAIRAPESLLAPQPFDARVTHDHMTRRIREEGVRSNAKLVAILLLAAALGCAAGYWGYLQLPPATISLQLRSDSPALIVSWPAQQTRDALYAAIRIDDSEPQPLSAEDRVAGQTELNVPNKNVKIELIVQHWMRDSRGIVRFVRALKPVPPPPEVEVNEDVKEKVPPPHASGRRSRRR